MKKINKNILIRKSRRLNFSKKRIRRNKNILKCKEIKKTTQVPSVKDNLGVVNKYKKSLKKPLTRIDI